MNRRKHWTSIWVSVLVEGCDPSIFAKRDQAHKKIKAALNSLPTFTDSSHQLTIAPNRPDQKFILGELEYLMDMEELKKLCFSATDYPQHLLDIRLS